jgi:hypothetical protein
MMPRVRGNFGLVGATVNTSNALNVKNVVAQLADQESLATQGNWPQGLINPPVSSLVVAGGGGGGGSSYGNNQSHPGGAGGFVANTYASIATGTTWTIGVGSAGAAATYRCNGVNGGNSWISGTGIANGGNVIAIGGGGGGAVSNGNAGGSGGGKCGTTDQVSMTGGVTGYGYGHAGSGCAGGGAGTAGGVGNALVGGAGLQWAINGSYYAAGGSGPGGDLTYGSARVNGIGGQGAGGAFGGTPTAGLPNTGSGGGAACVNMDNNAYGGNGGTGVVIIAIPLQYNNVTSYTGTMVYSVVNNYRLYQFNTSGSITF